jgi:apolipoprotein N-acyltransferase
LLSDLGLIFSGVLLLLASLPNPLAHFPPLIFVAFIPLISVNCRQRGWRRFTYNLAFCLLAALGLLFPRDIASLSFTVSDLLVLVAAFGLVASLYAGIFTLTAMITELAPPKFFPLCWASGWLVSQLLLSWLPFLFPCPIESALVPLPLFLQSAGIFGPYFLGSLIILTNTAIPMICRRDFTWATILLLLHLANIGYGWVALGRDRSQTATARVALIQPNISAGDYALAEKNKLLEYRFQQKLIELSQAALKTKPKLILWPELAGNYLLLNKTLRADVTRDVTSQGAELLLGTPHFDQADSQRTTNLAFILKPSGEIGEHYVKNRLFPFIESANYCSGNNFNALPSESGLGRVGTMICLESLYPQVARSLVKNGAKILILISTDAAFGNSMIPYIHKNTLALRAIENNRYALHVSNTGPSAAYDNKGRLLTEIPYGEKGYAVVNVRPISP